VVGRRVAAVLSIIVLSVLLAAPISPVGLASAQDYSFTLDEEILLVTINQDGSVDIDYRFRFGNVSNLDGDFGVDVGMPNQAYDLNSATASFIVNGNEMAPSEIRTSPYIDTGVAVELDQMTLEAIQQSGSFILDFHINNPQMVYRNELANNSAGVVVRPTWFSTEFQSGNTARINATILLPEGMTDPLEAQWIESNPFDPIYTDPSTGRLAASWSYINVDPDQQAAGNYDVGVGFPDRYVDVVFDPPQDGGILDSLGDLLCLLAPLLIIAIIIGMIFAGVRSASKRREDYFDPKMNVVGGGRAATLPRWRRRWSSNGLLKRSPP